MAVASRTADAPKGPAKNGRARSGQAMSLGKRFLTLREGSIIVVTVLTLIISHATPVTTPGTSAVGTPTFAQIFGGGTYSELFWAIGIVLILQIVLSLTRWGIFTVAVGGNRHGAAEAGVRVRLVLIRN